MYLQRNTVEKKKRLCEENIMQRKCKEKVLAKCIENVLAKPKMQTNVKCKNMVWIRGSNLLSVAWLSPVEPCNLKN